MQQQTKTKPPKAMIFDLDGTLFQTETALLPAYHAMFDQLREEGLYEGATPPEERILSSLGMLLEQIWERVMPDSPPKTRRRADELLLERQLEQLEQGIGELYPGVKQTLHTLSERGIKLYIASNGLEGYVKAVPQAMGIAHLFTDIYSAGQFGTGSKVDLVRMLLERHGERHASTWMIGDRSSDVEAGLKNDLFVVGCDYAGFRGDGELTGAHRTITSFPQLRELLSSHL